MSTYKLIQDIEAEDHIVGPLTLRQFIFALVSLFFLYINFIIAFKLHLYILLILFLPPALFFGFFAVPFGRDQPTEVWFLAKLRFWIKPRKRVWNQSSVKELVKINVPKKAEKQLTNGLNNYEVESRLKTLANTLDSRGWAVKNVSSPTLYSDQTDEFSDRLVNLDTLPTPVPDQSSNVPDIMDPSESEVAQHFNKMIDETNEAHRTQLVNDLNSDNQTQPQNNGNNQWFMPHIDQRVDQIYAADVPAQQETDEEKQLAINIQNSKANEPNYYGHIRVLPTTEQKSKLPPNSTQQNKRNPDIIKWATRDDVTIQTIDHNTKKPSDDKNNEVVIPLH